MRSASVFLCATLALPASAETAPYAGQDTRPVSSFSDADINALRAGDGWGLAKPAELNGWPGPRHILDLAEELELSTEQKAAVQAIFDAMNTRARALGAELIEAERALDSAFETGEIDALRLSRLLDDAEALRAALREAHLAAHIEATPVLTRHQRVSYARLRGYDVSGHGEGAHGSHR